MNLIRSIRNRINSNLSSQLIFILLPTIFILLGLGSWLVRNYVVNYITTLNEIHLVETVDTIEVVLQHTFMNVDVEMFQDTIFDIGVHQQANAVRVLSPDSVVLASSIPDEIGIHLNRQDPTCQACHTPDENQLPIKELQSFGNSNRRVILVVNQIDNQITCQGCHSDDQQYLGLILAEFPADQIENWHFLFDIGLVLGALMLGVLISSVVYLPLRKKVFQPIRALAQSLDKSASSPDENEIEQLSQRIRSIEKDLGDRENMLADQYRKIDTIFSLEYETDNPPALGKFFRQSHRIVREITGYETIVLRLYEPRMQTFRVMVQSGMSFAMMNDMEIIPESRGLHGEVIQSHLPAFTSNIPGDPRVPSDPPDQEGYRSLACIPLLAQDKLVGTMLVAERVEHAWSKEELRWLALIGRRIGLLIHHIQLTERLQNLAVMEERTRLAQEIHDGLAQLIGSLRLWSEDALIYLEENDPSGARKTIQKIETAARDAYASLRDEMLGLRTRIFATKDISEVISEFIGRFQRQWSIRTQLHLDESAVNGQPWPISPAAEVQLLRILQEGLTNIRRHAEASLISVTIAITDGLLKLRVEDDGIGFNEGLIPEDRLGLQIMRERAAAVGGTITVSSHLSKGTQLEINIPLRISQNIQKGEP